MPEEHWTTEVEHGKLENPETKEAFARAYGKYATQEDGLIGGFEAMQTVGRPFKLPESLEKLPDDKTRDDFVGGVSKLLGAVEKPEDLKDLNWTAGMAEGSEADENLVKMFSHFVVENKMRRSIVQKNVEFYNKLMHQAKEAKEAQESEDMRLTNEALVKHFNGEENLKKQIELYRRTFQNKAGLSGKEYEQVADELVDSGLLRHPLMARALLTLIAPLSAEGTTDTGDGVGGGELTEEQKFKKENPKTAQALGIK